MMRAFMLLLLAMLPAFTLAQQLCPDAPACNPATEPDRAKCKAEITGKTDAGRWVAWWWQDAPNKRWCPYQAACLNAYCSGPNVLNVLEAIRAGGIGAAQAAFGANPPAGTREEFDYLSLHYAACVAIAASRPSGRTDLPCEMKPPKPPASWVVDIGTDATKTTRPAYPFANGNRGTTSTSRATSGQPCRPEVAQSPSSTAGTVYAAFGPDYSAALVALCRKQ